MARVIVLDTGALPFDSTRRALLEREAARSDSGSTTSLRLATDAPASALAGAVAWLRTQPMQREIVVLSTFPVESLDSLDVAGIPRDIGVSLRRLPKAAPDTARDMTARSAPPTLGTVSWASNAADDVAGAVRSTVRSAVLSAVRGLGAVALSDAPALGAGRAVVGSLRVAAAAGVAAEHVERGLDVAVERQRVAHACALRFEVRGGELIG